MPNYLRMTVRPRRFRPAPAHNSRAPLIQIKVVCPLVVTNPCMQWQDIAIVPDDRDLELAVIDKDGPHALAFPCRHVASGWINAKTRQLIDVRPTHWREWTAKS